MDSVKITSSRNLRDLLRVISEESVRAARDELARDDKVERAKQAELEADMRRLSKHVTPSKKKEEAIDEESVSDLPSEKKPPSPEKHVKPEKEDPPQVPSAPSEYASPKIKFSMVKDALNSIRSGRSLRDREIRDEMKDYFRNLKSEEQEALYAFLQGISQILTAGIENEQAAEPSRDPHHIKMSRDEEDDDLEKGPPPQSSGDDDDDEDEEEEELRLKRQSKVSTGAEDTSPPIDVGRRQHVEGLRKYVRSLIK